MQGRTAKHVCAAAAVETDKPIGKAAVFNAPAGKGLGWYNGDDGYMYVDNMRVEDIRKQVCTPAAKKALVDIPS